MDLMDDGDDLGSYFACVDSSCLFARESLPVSGYSFVFRENIRAKCCWFYAFCVTLQYKGGDGFPVPFSFVADIVVLWLVWLLILWPVKIH